jgi:SAM-dependent methyltransferase
MWGNHGVPGRFADRARRVAERDREADTMSVDASLLGDCLTAPVDDDGFYVFSEPREFAHDEDDYDAHHGRETAVEHDPRLLASGRGLATLLREHGVDGDGPALEIGCGTGHITLGLVAAHAYPELLITDASPAFLRITRAKLASWGLEPSGVRYAILLAEEIERLPAGVFAAVFLRSTLHHILEVDAFIHAAAARLRAGGVLVFQEPCLEGFVVMGALAQCMPAVVESAGVELTPEQRERVEQFVQTVEFYARLDADKSEAEDKHLFRVDELMQMCDGAGLDLRFLPNTRFEVYALPPAKRPGRDRFTRFFRNYLRFCMGWPDDLLELFDRHLAPRCELVETIDASGNGPYLQGVFICTKR